MLAVRFPIGPWHDCWPTHDTITPVGFGILLVLPEGKSQGVIKKTNLYLLLHQPITVVKVELDGYWQCEGVRIKQMTEYIASSGDHSLFFLFIVLFLMHRVFKKF
jgi:hypothetical protein